MPLAQPQPIIVPLPVTSNLVSTDITLHLLVDKTFLVHYVTPLPTSPLVTVPVTLLVVLLSITLALQELVSVVDQMEPFVLEESFLSVIMDTC